MFEQQYPNHKWADVEVFKAYNIRQLSSKSTLFEISYASWKQDSRNRVNEVIVVP